MSVAEILSYLEKTLQFNVSYTQKPSQYGGYPTGITIGSVKLSVHMLNERDFIDGLRMLLLKESLKSPFWPELSQRVGLKLSRLVENFNGDISAYIQPGFDEKQTATNPARDFTVKYQFTQR